MAAHRQVARSLRHEQDEQREQRGRDTFRAEHEPPPRRDAPVGIHLQGVGVDYAVQAFRHGLHLRGDMVAQDDEIDEIHEKLAEDYGELVP